MSEDPKAIVRRFIEEVWNKGNLDLVDERVAATYVGHDPTFPMPIRGPEGFKQWVMASRNAFADLQLDIEDLIAEGDKVVGRFVMRGTHTGALPGLPPTGKPVVVTGIFIRHFENGKYVEGWDQADALTMLQQLGVIPQPSSA
jgi:steroid delta-isomerase-like uncharacterized protein